MMLMVKVGDVDSLLVVLSIHVYTIEMYYKVIKHHKVYISNTYLPTCILFIVWSSVLVLCKV